MNNRYCIDSNYIDLTHNQFVEKNKRKILEIYFDLSNRGKLHLLTKLLCSGGLLTKVTCLLLISRLDFHFASLHFTLLLPSPIAIILYMTYYYYFVDTKQVMREDLGKQKKCLKL